MAQPDLSKLRGLPKGGEEKVAHATAPSSSPSKGQAKGIMLRCPPELYDRIFNYAARKTMEQGRRYSQQELLVDAVTELLNRNGG